MKANISRKPTKAQNSRSREGAWIESYLIAICLANLWVAPVRERGLKVYCGEYGSLNRRRRSREGAWIESVVV